MRRGAMIYSEGYTLVAEIILTPHNCGADCICRQVRSVPAVSEEVRNCTSRKCALRNSSPNFSRQM
jgi:hypothetical protein